eukprot:9469245-Pyramimonas_sp.AAC.1
MAASSFSPVDATFPSRYSSSKNLTTAASVSAAGAARDVRRLRLRNSSSSRVYCSRLRRPTAAASVMESWRVVSRACSP